MAIDKKTLASLAVAGAGALALTSGKAEASTINYSGMLNQTVGFGSNPHQLTFNQFAASGGPSFIFSTKHSQVVSHFDRTLQVLSNELGGFAQTASHLHIATFSKSALWTINMQGGGGTRTVATRGWGGDSTHASRSGFTNKYYLFTFETNSLIQYGWLEATLQLGSANSNDPTLGPNLTVESYAYDASGAHIAAGDTGLATPEPSAMAESGIAALLLGAEGLRRWRKAGKARQA